MGEKFEAEKLTRHCRASKSVCEDDETNFLGVFEFDVGGDGGGKEAEHSLHLF